MKEHTQSPSKKRKPCVSKTPSEFKELQARVDAYNNATHRKDYASAIFLVMGSKVVYPILEWTTDKDGTPCQTIKTPSVDDLLDTLNHTSDAGERDAIKDRLRSMQA
jgi:hypothetical protein